MNRLGLGLICAGLALLPVMLALIPLFHLTASNAGLLAHALIALHTAVIMTGALIAARGRRARRP